MCFRLNIPKLTKKEFITIDGYEYIIVKKSFTIHEDDVNLYSGSLSAYKYNFERYKKFKVTKLDNTMQNIEIDEVRDFKAEVGYHCERLISEFIGFNTLPILIRPEWLQLVNKTQLICERFCLLDIDTMKLLVKKRKITFLSDIDKIYLFSNGIGYKIKYETLFNGLKTKY